MSLLASVQASWRSWLHDIWAILRLTAVPALLVILGALALIFLEQSLESIRALAEEAGADSPGGLIVLFVAAGLASFVAWYWSRAILLVLAPLSPDMNRLCRTVRIIAPLAWGAVPLLGLGAACGRTWLLWSARDDEVSGILFWSAIGAVALAVLFAVAEELYRRRATPEVPTTVRRRRVRELPLRTLLILAGSEALWFALMIILVRTRGQGVAVVDLNPPALVLLAVMIWIPLVSFLTYVGALSRLPVLRITLFAGLFFTAMNWNDNHLVRYQTRSIPDPRLVEPTFRSWLNARADLDDYDPYPVFLVATEGGGLRAAYFTAMVLTALQDQCPAFAQHVFAISGVSGGSVGATIFDALAARGAENRRRQPCLAPLTEPGPLRQAADSILKHDLLTPLVGMALFPDVFQRFLPFPVRRFDRALGLEVALEQAWTDVVRDTALQRPFHSLWTNIEHGAVPPLMLNSTLVSTGERILISPLDPQDERFNGLRNLEDLMGRGRTVSLATAAFLSARFPLVTPEAELPSTSDTSKTGERLVDGGYFENSGAATLLELLASLRICEAHSDTTRPAFMPVVIRIGYSVMTKPVTSLDSAGLGGEPATKFTANALSEVLTPVRALLNVRGARGVSAVGQLSTAITTFADRGIVTDDMIEFDLKRDSVPLVLGWQMSDRARQEVANQLGRAGGCAVNNAQRDCPLQLVRRVLENRRSAEPVPPGRVPAPYCPKAPEPRRIVRATSRAPRPLRPGASPTRSLRVRSSAPRRNPPARSSRGR